MRILIIRHAEPEYKEDSLTEKGFREAKLLAKWLKNEEIDYAYVSPLGRAQKTAEFTLKAKNMQAETKEFLREFNVYRIKDPLSGEDTILWDRLPRLFGSDPRLLHPTQWREVDWLKESDVPAGVDYVSSELDALLAQHGYERDGAVYRATASNKDTIALFCHFGIESVLLSHLWNVSPIVTGHFLCALPSSVTTLVTEEREEGIAFFRTLQFGSTQHLYAGKEPLSFFARWCETFDSVERH